jgi:hypothetical protein
LSKYQETYNRSLSNPDEFWSEAADQVKWIKKFDKVIHCEKNLSIDGLKVEKLIHATML